jgi:HAD superfamily hydrolase (TIGR01509 family)
MKMVSQKYRALLFDMDGLMVDTERLYLQANDRIAARYGTTVTMGTIAKMMGRATLESLRIFADDLRIAAEPRELQAQRDVIMLELVQSDLVTMPGLDEIIAYARQHFRLGLATGSSTPFMTEVLRRLGLLSTFDVLQSSDDLAHGKPNPEIYLRTAKRLSVEPEQSIVLEDSSNGVRAGWAAGCYVIAVPNEHTQAQDLSAAHVRLPDLHAAMAHIHGLCGPSEIAAAS